MKCFVLVKFGAAPLGLSHLWGLAHPGRWPGLTWGRPFGAEPQGQGRSFQDLAGATSQGNQITELGSAVQ